MQWPISTIRQRLSSSGVRANVIATGIAIAISLAAFGRASFYATQKDSAELAVRAEKMKAEINLTVETTAAVLDGISNMFDISDQITSQDFNRYTQRALKSNTAIKGISWAPRILAVQRRAFEQTTGIEIHQFDEAKNPVAAPESEEYFPIYYTGNRNGKDVLGYNIGSKPETRASVLLAKANQDLVFGSKTLLISGVTPNRPGVMLYRPVFRSGANNSRILVGFTTCAIDTIQLLENVLEHLGETRLDVDLFDAAAGKKNLLATWRPDRSITVSYPLTRAIDIDIMGQHWFAEIRDRSSTSLLPFMILITGLLLSALLCMHLETGRRYGQKLRELVNRDALTGLFNRQYLDQALLRESMRAIRNRSSLSALMIDIDRFKRVNDTFGHEVGDRTLKYLAQVLERNVRGNDLVCRYGGEEFVVLLPETPIDAAIAKAQALRVAVKDPILPDGTGITISIGVANLPLHAQDAAGLIRCADQVMYEVKAAGRDRAVVYGAQQSVDEGAPDPGHAGA